MPSSASSSSDPSANGAPAPDSSPSEGVSSEGVSSEGATGAPASDAASTPDAEPDTLGTAHEPNRLHPLTLLQRLLASLPAFLVILFPILQNPSSENLFSLVLSVVFGVFAIPAIVLQYWRFSYRIEPRQIVIQSGVFNRQNRSIPIERVQNIQIQQNLVAQIFGIAKVQVQTAGSSSTEGTLEYVGLQQAHRIRQTIRSFQRQQANADADAATAEDAAETTDADTASAPTTETLYTMSLGRVLLSGAFRFSFLYIAIIFSALQFVEPDTLLQWTFSSEQVDQVTAAITSHPAVAALVSIALAALLGWITGILLHLNRNFSFQLWLEDDKLRKRHGLFTVTEGTIPLEKVQTLVLKTNPLMRAFGWHELEVQTVGRDVEEQGHRVIVPFAQLEPIVALAQRVRPFEIPASFGSVSPLTIRRRFVRYSVALSAVLLPGVYFWPIDWWHPGGVALPWWGFALVPGLLLVALLQYRYHGYSVQDDGMYIRRGVLSHYLWMIPTEKFHVFYDTASLFQQRLHLKTLFVDTAGAAAFAYPEVIDLPEDEADEQLLDLHARFRQMYHDRIEAATGSATTRLSEDERPQLPDEVG
jgi:putative membrane protein